MGNLQTVTETVVGNYGSWDVEQFCGTDPHDGGHQAVGSTPPPTPADIPPVPVPVETPVTKQSPREKVEKVEPIKSEPSPKNEDKSKSSIQKSPSTPSHSSPTVAPVPLRLSPLDELPLEAAIAEPMEEEEPQDVTVTVKQEYKIRGRRVLPKKEAPDVSSSEDLPPSPVRLAPSPSETYSFKKIKTLSTKKLGRLDRPVKIIDEEVYNDKPAEYFLTSPRRSKRVNTSTTKEDPPLKKRRRNSGGSTELGEREVTGTTPLANYGATTTRATPSQAAKQKVKKALF